MSPQQSVTHQYNSSFGRGELDQDPLVGVGAPGAEAVSSGQPDSQEAGGYSVHLQGQGPGTRRCRPPTPGREGVGEEVSRLAGTEQRSF